MLSASTYVCSCSCFRSIRSWHPGQFHTSSQHLWLHLATSIAWCNVSKPCVVEVLADNPSHDCTDLCGHSCPQRDRGLHRGLYWKESVPRCRMRRACLCVVHHLRGGHAISCPIRFHLLRLRWSAVLRPAADQLGGHYVPRA